jgi:hypothetical protein
MATIAAPTTGFYSGEMGDLPRTMIRSAPSDASARGGNTNLNLVLVDSRRHARDFIESTDGEALIMDIVRRRRVELGIRS